MTHATTKKVPIEALLRHDNTRLRRAAAKLTHVGEQTRPVSTIVIQSYYYLASLDIFHALRSPGIAYHNDELPVVLNFSASPGEMRRIVEQAGQVWGRAKAAGAQPSLSFAAVVDAPEGREGGEILLSREDGIALHQALRAALDPKNGTGAAVLEIQRSAAYTNG